MLELIRVEVVVRLRGQRVVAGNEEIRCESLFSVFI